ncbi:unnamed protein product [Cochlearia groenlandica]
MVTTRRMKGRVTANSHRRSPTELESPVKKFFKVVLPSTMQTNMLRIPTRFVKLQGTKLSKVVTLETPVGFKRNIKLKRIGEELWFQEGWSEFAEANSINKGHFLLFEYKGNSSFRVLIFDVTTSEIEYPLDEVHISDSDDDIIDVTMRNDQLVVNKRPRDTEFEKILNDLDAISSEKVLEEREDKRVFKGKHFF